MEGMVESMAYKCTVDRGGSEVVLLRVQNVLLLVKNKCIFNYFFAIQHIGALYSKVQMMLIILFKVITTPSCMDSSIACNH